MEDSQSVGRAQRIIKWVIILGVFVLVGAVVVRAVAWELRPRTLVSAGQVVFQTDIASSDHSRQRGLGGRSELGSGEAMLFKFDTDDYHGIWMKGMRFPIDIIWMDSEKQVVHIEEGVQPEGEPYTIHKPSEPARFVLEVASGQAKKAKIQVGTIIKFDITEEGL